jgi:hypothetical protein
VDNRDEPDLLRRVEVYVQSYIDHPETDEELVAAMAFLRAAWDTEDP